MHKVGAPTIASRLYGEAPTWSQTVWLCAMHKRGFQAAAACCCSKHAVVQVTAWVSRQAVLPFCASCLCV